MEDIYPTKLLFICSQNRDRSLTAERIYERFEGYRVVSAGTEPRARVKVSPGDIGWADWIFVMEKKHVRFLKDKYNDLLDGKKVICLNIPDDFKFMDPELIEILKGRLSEYIDVPD